VIAEYVDRLAAELRYDPPLSRRVRREVEDHLRAAAAADPAGGPEAERRAVAGFGDPRAIAAQFAAGSLAKRARRVGAAAVLLIAAVFVAMKARLVWYGVMQCPVAEEFQALGAAVASVDRYAFWLAGAVGVAGWTYIDRVAIPAAMTREYRARLGRFFVLGSAAAALIVSVASDAILTSLRIVGTPWSAASWLPVFSVAVELACAGVLVSHLRGIARRAAAVSPA
jgi:hypothetical protein